MKLQSDLENYYQQIAYYSKKPVIILCDRGLMDGKAYLSEEVWQALLDTVGKNSVSLRDKRYDLVVHLVTAANGALEFYDFENNPARHEVRIFCAADKNF